MVHQMAAKPNSICGRAPAASRKLKSGILILQKPKELAPGEPKVLVLTQENATIDRSSSNMPHSLSRSRGVQELHQAERKQELPWPLFNAPPVSFRRTVLKLGLHRIAWPSTAIREFVGSWDKEPQTI